MLRKILTGCLAFIFVLPAGAQSLKTPTPSPTTTVKQDFGLSAIELNYSRPGIKGRKIFGDLVPYGKVWRTGANSATTISFGDEVTIGGKKIPAGKYGLLTIPGETEWTIIITKQTNVNNPSLYKPEEDVARVKITPQILPFSIETFTIEMEDITNTSLVLGIMWDNVYVGIPVTTEIDSKVMAQIDAAMKTDKPPYFQAAAYYLDNNKDLNKALEWFTKAEAENKDAYWVVYQKAKCLAKLGKKQEAIAEANKSKEIATAQKNADYVKLNDDLIKSLQ